MKTPTSSATARTLRLRRRLAIDGKIGNVSVNAHATTDIHVLHDHENEIDTPVIKAFQGKHKIKKKQQQPLDHDNGEEEEIANPQASLSYPKTLHIKKKRASKDFELDKVTSVPFVNNEDDIEDFNLGPSRLTSSQLRPTPITDLWLRMNTRRNKDTIKKSNLSKIETPSKHPANLSVPPSARPLNQMSTHTSPFYKDIEQTLNSPQAVERDLSNDLDQEELNSLNDLAQRASKKGKKRKLARKKIPITSESTEIKASKPSNSPTITRSNAADIRSYLSSSSKSGATEESLHSNRKAGKKRLREPTLSSTGSFISEFFTQQSLPFPIEATPAAIERNGIPSDPFKTPSTDILAAESDDEYLSSAKTVVQSPSSHQNHNGKTQHDAPSSIFPTAARSINLNDSPSSTPDAPSALDPNIVVCSTTNCGYKARDSNDIHRCLHGCQSCSQNQSQLYPCFQAVASSSPGPHRNYQQDAFSMEYIKSDTPILIVGVYDGHGQLGENAARIAAETIPHHILRSIINDGDKLSFRSQSLDTSICRILKQAAEKAFTSVQATLEAIAHSEYIMLKRSCPQLISTTNSQGLEFPHMTACDDPLQHSIVGDPMHKHPFVESAKHTHKKSEPSSTSNLTHSELQSTAIPKLLLNPISSRLIHSFPDLDYGTTAAVATVYGKNVCVAWAGDSECILLQRTFPKYLDMNMARGPKSKDISDDRPLHKWSVLLRTTCHDAHTQHTEFTRLEQAGAGLIRLGDQVRVFPGDMTLEEARTKHLTLNMSRALGHRVLSKWGITSKPSMLTLTIPTHGSHESKHHRDESVEDYDEDIETDYWLMLCSDGISDVLPLDARLEIMNKYIHRINIQDDQTNALSATCRNLHEISSAFLAAAAQNWGRMNSGDNATAIVVRIRIRVAK